MLKNKNKLSMKGDVSDRSVGTSQKNCTFAVTIDKKIYSLKGFHTILLVGAILL